MAVMGFTWLVVRISNIAAERWAASITKRQTSSKLAVLTLLHRLFKIGVATAGAVTTVYVVGGDVTALLAGVGLGGIVIALAAQKTLENLFGGVAVISDEPIRVGDFCRFVDKFGTVEDIGLRSTRVRTLDRTILSIPNGQLSLMTLENFTLRDKFLFNQHFGVRYETTPAQLRCILREIRDLLLAHPKAEGQDVRVRFVKCADSAFLVEVFTYLSVADHGTFLEAQEELLMSILDIIVAAGSGLAYPSQTLYVTRDKPHDPASVDQAAARARQRNGTVK
jgi:MscS family membrane protein